MSVRRVTAGCISVVRVGAASCPPSIGVHAVRVVLPAGLGVGAAAGAAVVAAVARRRGSQTIGIGTVTDIVIDTVAAGVAAISALAPGLLLLMMLMLLLVPSRWLRPFNPRRECCVGLERVGGTVAKAARGVRHSGGGDGSNSVTNTAETTETFKPYLVPGMVLCQYDTRYLTWYELRTDHLAVVHS